MGNNAKPFFTIITATYNRADLLKRSINSILSQDFPLFELIIEDDGSTDNTEEIVKSFTDNRIRYFKDKENKGPFAAKNRGVKMATGEYIMFLDSDDEFVPGALRIIFNRISGEKGNYKQFGFQQITCSKKGFYPPPKYFINNVKEISYIDCLSEIYKGIYTHGVTSSEIKNEIVLEEKIRGGYLSLLWYELIRKYGPLRIYPDIVKMYHRDNDDTITKTLTKNTEKMIRNRALQSSLFLERFGDDLLKINPRRYTFEALRSAESYLLLKEPEKARKFLRQLIANKKADLKTYLYLIICFSLNLISKITWKKKEKRKENIRVLFIIRGNIKLASSRTRVFEYLKYLKEKGVEYKIYEFPTRMPVIKFMTNLYRAFHDIFWCNIIFIQKTIPFLPIQYLLKSARKKIIFDFDDSIFDVRDDGSFKGNYLKELKSQNKRNFNKIIKLADHIITNNTYNKAFIETLLPKNISIILSPVNTNKLYPKPKKASEKIIVGWIGHPCYNSYLHNLDGILKTLAQKYKSFALKVVGINDYKIDGVPLISKDWDLEDELSDLQSFDIGIMPLPDNDWTRGKGGYKLLQYMSVGIPCIASPVGVNKDIIENGVNGFLASSNDEWIEKLSLLIENPDLRNSMGNEGRKIAVEKYSVDANFNKFLNVIEEVYNNT